MKPILDLSARRLALLLIGAPLLLAAIYLGFFAADRYVSESSVSVRQAGGDIGSVLPGAAALLASVSPPARQDALFLTRYIHSLALLQTLDAELGLRKHYGSPGTDLLFRLPPGQSQEDFLDYYRQRVEVGFDDATALLSVKVQGFDPAFARQLNQRILELSERFVNESSHGVAREQLRFVQVELKTAAERLQKARDQLLAFQSKNRMLDPTGDAQASGAISAELQASLTRRETELKNLLSYLNERAPQVRTLNSEIKALRAQLDAERTRATNAGKQGERLNALAADFQALRMQADFAADAYKLALAGVEAARVEATRKLKTLVVVEPPSLAETARYPQRAYTLGTLFVACLLLYAIVRLVLATVREHQD